MGKKDFPGVMIIGCFLILRGAIFVIAGIATLDIAADSLILALIFITSGYFVLCFQEFGRKLTILLSVFNIICIINLIFNAEIEFIPFISGVYGFCNFGLYGFWAKNISAVLYLLYIYFLSLPQVREEFNKKEYTDLETTKNQNKALSVRLKNLNLQLVNLYEILEQKNKIIGRYTNEFPQGDGLAQDTDAEIDSKQTKLAEQKKARIGEILLKQKLITKEILNQALEYQRQFGGSITQYLLYYGYIDERQLAQCLCAQFGIPYLPLESYDISEEIIKLVPVDIAEKFWLVPVDKHGDTLMIAMIDPLDTKVIKQLEELTGFKIRPFVGIISEITRALQVYYKVLVKDGKFALKTLPFFIDTKIYKGNERRNSIRYYVEIPVQFPAQGRYCKCKTVNLSRNGFALEAEISVSLGSVIPLEIDLPESVYPLPILALVQVVRCEPLKNKNFSIAFKTLKMSKQEIDTVIDYAVRFVKK